MGHCLVALLGEKNIYSGFRLYCQKDWLAIAKLKPLSLFISGEGEGDLLGLASPFWTHWPIVIGWGGFVYL